MRQPLNYSRYPHMTRHIERPYLRRIAPGFDISVSHRDGAYIKTIGTEHQVIVVGPMKYSPQEFCEAAEMDAGQPMEITSTKFLESDDASTAKITMYRGVVSIMMKNV